MLVIWDFISTHIHDQRQFIAKASPAPKLSVVCVSPEDESPITARTSSRASEVLVFRITLWLRRNLSPGAARKAIDADFGALKLSRLQWTQFRTCNNDLLFSPTSPIPIWLAQGGSQNQVCSPFYEARLQPPSLTYRYPNKTSNIVHKQFNCCKIFVCVMQILTALS